MQDEYPIVESMKSWSFTLAMQGRKRDSTDHGPIGHCAAQREGVADETS